MCSNAAAAAAAAALNGRRACANAKRLTSRAFISINTQSPASVNTAALLVSMRLFVSKYSSTSWRCPAERQEEAEHHHHPHLRPPGESWRLHREADAGVRRRPGFLLGDAAPSPSAMKWSRDGATKTGGRVFPLKEATNWVEKKGKRQYVAQCDAGMKNDTSVFHWVSRQLHSHSASGGAATEERSFSQLRRHLWTLTGGAL